MATKRTKLPPDPEGKNKDRADWANVALAAFGDETGQTIDGDGPQQMIADLLCDLAHFCDRNGLSFAVCLSSGRNHYEEETSRKGTQFPAAPEVEQGEFIPGKKDAICAAICSAEDICTLVNRLTEKDEITHGITLKQAADYLAEFGREVSDAVLKGWTEDITPIPSLEAFVAEHAHNFTDEEFGQ